MTDTRIPRPGFPAGPAGIYVLRAFTADGWAVLEDRASRTRISGDLARLPADQIVEVWQLVAAPNVEPGYGKIASGEARDVLRRWVSWDWNQLAWRWPWQSRGRVWWKPWQR